MATIDKNTIYSWFQTDDFPTEEQFRATWDSFWHKNETIPMSSISGLNQMFQQTATLGQLNAKANIDGSNIDVAAYQSKLQLAQLIATAKQEVKYELLDGAPEAFDTLKEISTWISNNETAEAAILQAIQNEATARTNADNLKLDKPTSTGDTELHPYVVLVNMYGETVRYNAGDLGKNFFNSDLSNNSVRNHIMNASVTVDTLGNAHSLKNLPNKNTDIANFRKVRVQNASGLDAVVDSKKLLTDGVTSMTDAEKDAWRLAQRKSNENYNTGFPQISNVNPFLIKNTDDYSIAITVTGSNLFIDLVNSIVTMKRVKDLNGNNVSDAEINITQYIGNSESNNLMMLIYYNFYNAALGYYELKIQNQYGLQNLTSPQFLIVENYDLTPILPFSVINSRGEFSNNITINNSSFELDLLPNITGGLLFDKIFNSTNGDINCIVDLDVSIKIPRTDYIFGEILLGFINNDLVNNISSSILPKIGFKLYNINAWTVQIVDINTNKTVQTISWSSQLIFYLKFKVFIKDGTYTIANTLTGQTSQGFYNDFNELRFMISKNYSTPMPGGKISVSVSNFKKL